MALAPERNCASWRQERNREGVVDARDRDSRRASDGACWAHGVTGFDLLACEAEPPEPRFYRERPRLLGVGKPVNEAADERPKSRSPATKRKPTRQAPAARPTAPDPMGGKFTLEQALSGLPEEGHAATRRIETSLGRLECKLYADKAPLTVANFVGLARGERPFWDANQGAWVKRPLYDGTTFHRVIRGFMIQGGDHLGTGAGDTGYNRAR